MSFFGAIQRAFTPPGTGFLEAQMQQAQQQALAAAAEAEAETKKAIKQAQEAALGPLDSESAKQAAEARQRQLMGMQGSAWSFGPMLGGGAGTQTMLGA
jgi:hypothetical protein